MSEHKDVRNLSSTKDDTVYQTIPFEFKGLYLSYEKDTLVKHKKLSPTTRVNTTGYHAWIIPTN